MEKYLAWPANIKTRDEIDEFLTDMEYGYCIAWTGTRVVNGVRSDRYMEAFIFYCEGEVFGCENEWKMDEEHVPEEDCEWQAFGPEAYPVWYEALEEETKDWWQEQLIQSDI